MDTYYTIPEVAKLLKVSRQTLYNWISAGKLRTVHFSSGTVRIKASEIERMEKDGRAD